MFRALLMIGFGFGFSLEAEQNWYPVDVQADGKKLQYQPLQKITKAWRLCALLPHGKDHY